MYDIVVRFLAIPERSTSVEAYATVVFALIGVILLSDMVLRLFRNIFK